MDNDILARRAQEEHRYWLNQNERQAFSWLGGRWTDTELRQVRFESFDVNRQQEAYDAVQMFRELLSGTLILYGPYGTGKTHLLAALCNSLLDLEIASRFVTAPNLFAAITGRMSNREEYDDLLFQAIRTPLLVIDDIDKAKHSDFREEIYFDIIDGRVKRKLPIALSTNRLSELESFVGGACLSRLSIKQLAVEMTGSDYRTEL